MSNYFTCLKLLISYIFKRSKGEKSSKWMWLVFAILGVFFSFIMVGLVFIMIGMTTSFVSLGLTSELATIIILIGCVFMLIMGTISMLSYLYFSRDTEFFLSLPIKTSTVFMSKLTVVYLTELLFNIFLTLPCIITMGIIAGLSPVFYVTMIVAMLFAPMIPLFISSILAIPLMYLVSFFKNKGALSSIAGILLFAVFFGLYFFAISSFSSGMGEGFDPEQAVIAMQNAIKNITTIFYPILAVARFATMETVFGLSVPLSMLVNLGFFILPIVILGALALLISNTVYRKGALTQLEGAQNKHAAKVDYSSSGAVKALLSKEWKELIRTPSFAFQCLSGLIISPLLLIFMNLFNGGISVGGQEVTGVDAQFMSMAMAFVSNGIIMMMGIGMNIAASTSITREGQMFYYCKMIPVSYADQLKAKKILYLIISMIAITISLVTLSIISFNPLFFILSLGFLIIYNYGFINFSILFDLNRPKLDWVTAQEAIKNNRSTIVPMFINMGLSLVIIIAPIILVSLVPLAWLGMTLAWVFLYIIALAVAIIFHFVLKTNSEKMFDKLYV